MSLSLPWEWSQISDAAAALGYDAEKRASELSRICARKPSAQPESLPLMLWRDLFGWCPFCHQVQLHLEEKGVSYRVRRVPLSTYRIGQPENELIQDSPGGFVPALRIYDTSVAASSSNCEPTWTVLRGGNDIAKFIERHYSGRDFLQIPGVNSTLVRAYLSLLDVALKNYDMMIQASIVAMQDPEDHGLQRSASEAESWLLDVCEDINAAIQESGGPYFFGDSFTVVDMAYAPWIDRIAAMLMFLRNTNIRDNRFRAIDAWALAMSSHPAHRSLRLDDETIVRVAAISWDLPLSTVRSLASSWILAANASCCQARAEAMQCVAACHAGVIDFATHRAPLLPTSAIDAFLRTLATAALDDGRNTLHSAVLNGADAEAMAAALIFVRSRIAVPRDMSEPAAQYLRHLLQQASEQIVGKHVVASLIQNEFYSYKEKLTFRARR